MSSLLSPQLKRLLSYVRPYAFRLSLGVVLVAFVALAEGMVAFMVKIAVDYVLNPSVFVTKPVLFTLPGNRVDLSKSIFSLLVFTTSRLSLVAGLVGLYLGKGHRRVFGHHTNSIRRTVRNHRSSQSGLRKNHPPAHRLLSAQSGRSSPLRHHQRRGTHARGSLRISRRPVSKGIQPHRSRRRALLAELENGAGLCCAPPSCRHPGWKIWPQNQAFRGKQPDSPRRPQPDSAGNDHWKSRRQSLRNGRFRNPQIPRHRSPVAARQHALGARCRHHSANHGLARRHRHPASTCSTRAIKSGRTK